MPKLHSGLTCAPVLQFEAALGGIAEVLGDPSIEREDLIPIASLLIMLPSPLDAHSKLGAGHRGWHAALCWSGPQESAKPQYAQA